MNKKLHRIILYPSLLLFTLGLTGCRWEQYRELVRNREKWEQLHVTSYRYKVSILSQWGINDSMPLSIRVEDGEPVVILDMAGNDVTATWKDGTSIEAMFAEIETALSMSSRKLVEVQYDPNYGFPTNFVIFYNEQGVGGEYERRYMVRDFGID